ncbi:MAG: spermidine synthase, partial [bacterium]
VTQATSPFFSKNAFLSILKSMRAIGIPAIAYHNNIPTLGEWGWVLGMNAPNVESNTLKAHLTELSFADIETRFLNHDAVMSMLYFGKGMFDHFEEIVVNDELNLSLYQYYRDGAWDIY